MVHHYPSSLLVTDGATIQPLTICTDNEYSNDISDYVKTKGIKMTDYNKAKILELSNMPVKDFVYPFSTHVKKRKEEKRYLNSHYCERCKWLVYSTEKNGLYCKYCVLFADKGGKCNNVDLQKFVTKPLTKYAKLSGKTGDLAVHNSHQYHINSVTSEDYFLLNHKKPQNEVINLINTQINK